MAKILCLYTGGTIGCQPANSGLKPVPGLLHQEILALGQQLTEQIELSFLEYPQLLDSSSMGPTNWNQIVHDIAKYYPNFDGFVVLHGTDTLAYTAAALAFQLEGLGKPVLITGSQYPWLMKNSDAPSNVALALRNACGAWGGVRVAFAGQLFPATRVKKHSTESSYAFNAPNWDGDWFSSTSETQTFRAVSVQPDARIISIKLYPGMTYDWLADALALPQQGIVLESFGSGNLPTHAGLIAALTQQAQQGTIIINCSQCHAGQVHAGQYAASQNLLDLGALPAYDMTSEAALCKLYYLYATCSNTASIKQDFLRNLRGEIRQSLC